MSPTQASPTSTSTSAVSTSGKGSRQGAKVPPSPMIITPVADIVPGQFSELDW